ncbi:MAG: Uma2 family endonuclease [Nitrososphaera sp.]|nr:Uma2 family endonuclease [Blastocatellia bacterium]MCI0563314.1 Uma2 family endonuclease [Nitrososphaera sp.]
MSTKTQATIEDLYNVPEDGKAEIVNGELKLMPPTGDDPARAGGRIYSNLDQYERRTGAGYAYPDNVGFKANLPHRESFSPDAAFYTGQRTGMKFLNGPPVFAVEVRSENDYGPQAEKEIAEKRRDYFAAGTIVVWDVDLLNEDVIKVYRASEPDKPTIYRRGQEAEAEPAVPGWKMPVDDMFG